MATLCFRRPNGQHFLVFYESISQAIVGFSKIDIPEFQMIEPLENYLAIRPGEERFMGSTDRIQLLLTVGHTRPSVMAHTEADDEVITVQGPTGPQEMRITAWPEHFVVVHSSRIKEYLLWNQRYGWPEDKFKAKGPFDAMLTRAVYMGDNVFLLPENHYVETLLMMAHKKLAN